jgi:hypothetical protein
MPRPTLNRESFQSLLASAFLVQDGLDARSRSEVVEVLRSILIGELFVNGSMLLIAERTRSASATGMAIGVLNGDQLAPRDRSPANKDAICPGLPSRNSRHSDAAVPKSKPRWVGDGNLASSETRSFAAANTASGSSSRGYRARHRWLHCLHLPPAGFAIGDFSATETPQTRAQVHFAPTKLVPVNRTCPDCGSTFPMGPARKAVENIPKRVRIGDTEIDYISEDVTMRHFIGKSAVQPACIGHISDSDSQSSGGTSSLMA